LIYKNKIGNIDFNDHLFISAYENHNPQIILFMLDYKYIPSNRVKVLIKSDYEQSLEINNVEKRKNIEVTKYFTNAQFEYKEKIYPVKKVDIRDVSGAGDTFMSGLVVEYIRTADIKESILFAQECATVVVQKPGVATI
jgi:fructose-1-phosphate kinase PfkB-like protein